MVSGLGRPARDEGGQDPYRQPRNCRSFNTMCYPLRRSR